MSSGSKSRESIVVLHALLLPELMAFRCDQNLPMMWKENYKHTLNSVDDSISPAILLSFEDANHYVKAAQYYCTVALVKSLACKLKLISAPGVDGLQAEHILHSHESIYLHRSILSNLCLFHNFIPASCIPSVITPIVKNKQDDAGVSLNYRPITVTSIISKLLEHFILYKIRSYLVTVDNQFGFKERHSTDMCIFLLKQLVSHYTQHGSSVFAIFLDASKAFDKVNHSLLFEKMIKHKVPMIFIRLLQYWYSNQSMCVKWESHVSTSFSVSNGVRQGGVMSPLLFSLYMNQFSFELNSLDIEGMIGSTCINDLMYADDICCFCLAPSFKGLQKLVNKCCMYADDHNITFNSSKTKAMWFKTNFLNLNFMPGISMYNAAVEFVSKVKYLGIILNSNRKDDDDIGRQLRSTYGIANMLRSKFSFCSNTVTNCLFRTFCSAMYGLSLWCLYLKSCMNRIRVAYNNAYRILFYLPPQISISTVTVRNNISTFEAIRRKSVAMFVTRCYQSSNKYIVALAQCDDFVRSQFYSTFTGLHL